MKTRMLIFVLTLALMTGNVMGKVGDIVKHEGFEGGAPGSLPTGCGMEKEGGAEGTVAIDSTQSHSGKHGLLIDMQSSAGYLHPSISVTLKPGSYILRAWAKAEPEQSFIMQAYDTRKWRKEKPAIFQLGNGIITKECRANNKEWSKFEIEFDVTETFPASIQIGLKKPGKLWLDDIEIVESARDKTEVIATHKAMVTVVQTEQNIEISNDKITLSIGKGNHETVFSYMLAGRQKAASIKLFENSNELLVNAIKVIKNSPALIEVQAVYGTAEHTANLTYTVKNNSEYIKIFSSSNVPEIKINFVGQALVIPDQLAEDIVLYPGQLGKNALHLPSDNLLALNMLNDGNAMLSCVWQSDSFKIDEIQNVAKKRFDALIIKPAEGQAFWLGINSAVAVWHQVKEKLNATKPVKIGWTPPFTARWVATMREEKGLNEWESGLCDSWPIIDKVPGAKAPVIKQGIGITNTATWAAWSSFIGGYTYPCNFEKNGCFIQYPFFPNHQNIVYDSKTPVVIYPLQKVKGSPVNMLLPLDALELFAGKEAAGKLKTFRNHDDRYPATCGVTEVIEKIFYRGEQVKLKDRINERLKLMDLFVINIRKRIEIYLEWERKLLAELNSKQKNNPGLTSFIEPYAKQLNAMQWRYAEAVEKMRQPEYCATLSAKMSKLIDADIDDEQKEEESKQLGRMIRVIGGGQDSTLGAMRYFVKCLRQNSTLNGMTCEQPQEQDICKLLRRETAEILRPKCGMEGK